jgi:hypothetical protein
MIDWIAYSPVPYEERCESVGRPTYSPQAAYEECARTIALLRKLFGREPDGACLSVGSNPHDAGIYHDVRCWFDAGNATAYAYALAIDADFPVGWHDERVRDWRAKHGVARAR